MTDAPRRHALSAGLADRSALEARFPDAFRTDWRTRAKVSAFLATGAALAAYAFVCLDIEWARVWIGIGRLGQFVSVMLPPMCQSCTDMYSVNSQGNTMTANTTTPAGATNGQYVRA